MIEQLELGGALQDSILFRNLGEHELDVIAGLLREGSVRHGEYLFREKDPGDRLYVLRSGTIQVEKSVTPDKRLHIARLGGGEFLGEMGLISNAPRSLDAIALEDTTFWVLTQVEFARLCASQPALGLHVVHNIAHVLSQRLLATNIGIARLYRELDSAEASQSKDARFAEAWRRSFRIREPEED